MIAIIKAHFEWSVMDNPGAANAIVQKGMETGKEKLEELQDLSIPFKDDRRRTAHNMGLLPAS